MSDNSQPTGETMEHVSLPQRKRGLLQRLIRATFLYLFPLVIVAVGVMGAMRLYETGPKAERRQPPRQATLVEVQTLEHTRQSAMIHVMGTVVAAQEVMLQPRVNGEIVKLSPKLVPGGCFEAGEFILEIDSKDYELAVDKAKSEVAQAEYEWKVEQGYQEVARHEWDELGMSESASERERELALRKPHLLKVEAGLEAAKAALRDAELDLERTVIRAPFNCMVTTETVDLGAQVNTQTQLAVLVGTDEYWVRVSVPVDQLPWVQFPGSDGEEGFPAIIRQQLETGVYHEWRGRVARLMGDLEPEGRMARVLVSVRDPLGLGASGPAHLPLLIGAYVNVALEGREIENVIALPRTTLRNGHQVWLMDDENKLEIRDVDVFWGNRDTVLLREGVEAGERLVVTDLAAPVAGMDLKLQEDGTDADEPDRLAHEAGEGVKHVEPQ